MSTFGYSYHNYRHTRCKTPPASPGITCLFQITCWQVHICFTLTLEVPSRGLDRAYWFPVGMGPNLSWNATIINPSKALRNLARRMKKFLESTKASDTHVSLAVSPAVATSSSLTLPSRVPRSNSNSSRWSQLKRATYGHLPLFAYLQTCFKNGAALGRQWVVLPRSCANFFSSCILFATSS